MGKKKKFFNNSYALNKPYRGPFFKKRINHTHLIREKRRTIFPKKISHTYGLFGTEVGWELRVSRMGPLGSGPNSKVWY